MWFWTEWRERRRLLKLAAQGWRDPRPCLAVIRIADRDEAPCSASLRLLVYADAVEVLAEEEIGYGAAASVFGMAGGSRLVVRGDSYAAAAALVAHALAKLDLLAGGEPTGLPGIERDEDEDWLILSAAGGEAELRLSRRALQGHGARDLLRWIDENKDAISAAWPDAVARRRLGCAPG